MNKSVESEPLTCFVCVKFRNWIYTYWTGWVAREDYSQLISKNMC